MRVAIITANTDIYRGREENESGEVIKKIVEEATDLDDPVIRPPMTGDGKNLSA